MCSPYGGSSGKALVSWEIEVKPIVHERVGWLWVLSGTAKRGDKGAIEHFEVVRAGWPLPATWVSISGKHWFWNNGGTKTVKKWEFPAGIAYMRVPCSSWFSPSRVEF